MLAQYTVYPSLPVADLESARRFYQDVLGFTATEANSTGVFFQAAKGTAFFIYPSGTAGANPNTAAAFEVEDLEREMADLRARGVVFEEYDTPGLKTNNGIATLPDYRAAWFKDPDGNILGVSERRTGTARR